MAKSLRKMPVKVVRVELEGEWEGWWMDVRKSALTRALLNSLQALKDSNPEKDPLGATDAMCRIVKLLVRGWNFVDEDGHSLPLNQEGLDMLPLDLLMTACNKAQEVILLVPLETKSS